MLALYQLSYVPSPKLCYFYLVPGVEVTETLPRLEKGSGRSPDAEVQERYLERYGGKILSLLWQRAGGRLC